MNIYIFLFQTKYGDYMSIWNINEKKREYKKLAENKKVDILIIGGGITGLTSAYYLSDSKDICIVDANIIGHGVTLNSTAKINYFQECIYSKIIKKTNYNNAVKYLNSQRYAIDELKKIIEKENIACDFKKTPSYVFASSEEQINVLDREIKFLRHNNIDATKNKLPINIPYYKSYFVSDTYIFNPIKYLNGLYNILSNKNVSVYENTKIIKIERDKNKNEYVCYSDKYKICAKKVILATHYPFFLIPFIMPIRCSIEKSYIIVSKVKKDKNFTCISADRPTYSCRYYEDKDKFYQISLSKSHDIYSNNDDKYHFDRVKEIFELENKNIIMKYTNSDVMTPDHMPYIGKLKENLYIGVGYNTWGMTNGVLAAKIITDEILCIENKYNNVFNPNRFNIQTIINFPVYIYNNAKSYIGTKLIKNKYWYSSRVKFYKRGGKLLALYKDKNGKNHIVYNKCPHLGCSLIFNETEKTWDCPCHSSRFDLDGKCIKGPSNYDISYEK